MLEITCHGSYRGIFAYISGNMIENMIVTCGTKAEVTSWLEALKNHVIPTPSTTSSKPVSLQVVNNIQLLTNEALDMM